MALACTAKPIGLLDLPGELRNEIYGYALVHHNGGIIAPTAESERVLKNCWTGYAFETIVDGEVRKLVRPADTEALHTVNGDDDPPQPWHAHICTLACQLQPSLTQVSRQIRDETLPVFYGANTFHVAFDPPLLQQPDVFGVRKSDMRAWPRAWWRAIGDTNLRMIKHVRYDTSTYQRVRLVFAASAFSVVERPCDRARATDDDMLRSIEARIEERMPTDARRQLEEDGLFVRGLERVLHGLEIIRGDVTAW